MTVDGTREFVPPASSTALGGLRCRVTMAVTNGGFTTGLPRQAVMYACAVASSAAIPRQADLRHKGTPESASDCSLLTTEPASIVSNCADAISCLHNAHYLKGRIGCTCTLAMFSGRSSRVRYERIAYQFYVVKFSAGGHALRGQFGPVKLTVEYRKSAGYSCHCPVQYVNWPTLMN